MEKYIIEYVTTEGDTCRVWVEAESADEAVYKAKQEYWDIKMVIGARKG